MKKVEIQTKSSGMAGSKGPSSFELLSKVQVLVSKTPTNKDEEDENNVDNNDKSPLKLALKSNVARLSRATKDVGKAKERVERWQQSLKQLKKKESDFKNPAKRPKIEKLKTPAQLKKEPGCPSQKLPKEFLKFTGSKNDRQALSKWNKGKEKAEEAIKASVDAYVEKRREEIRKTGVFENGHEKDEIANE